MTHDHDHDTDPPEYADVHENGQLRLGIPGEQMPMLPLPDDDLPYDPSTVPLPEGF